MQHSPLLTKIHEYEHWREQLKKTIADYRDWLANSPQSDSVKELRLYDMVETINNDQLILAFLADSGRGKTQTINALFFSDLGFSFFPNETGGDSSCSTEIQWNENEEPSIRLLPISTRQSDDTLAYLKTTPNVWEKYKLDPQSPESIQTALNKLSEQLDVTESEAISLGLWDATDKAMVKSLEETGRIKVPVWRHAIINYPHPALKAGLVVIDTPSLEQLNAEPELTLNMIPKANAAIFLTAADNEVSANDINTWNEQIKNRVKLKYVLLNKIDTLWGKQQDEQKLTNDVSRLVNTTAHKFRTSPEVVYPISAQQAITAKRNQDEALLSKSQLLTFEEKLGEQLIEAKHEMYGKTIASECSVMIKHSRQFIQQRRSSLKAQLDELKDLQGKNISKSQEILKTVVAEKKRYEASIPTFNQANEKISKHGKKLLKHLSVDYLDASIQKSRQEIGDSWTTAGLNKGMRNTMKQASELAEHVTKQSKKIKILADTVYQTFHEKHGFDTDEAPDLDMSVFLDSMRELVNVTDNFCKDPINLMTEKRFLVRRFFLSLGTQQQKIFEQAREDCELWLLDVLSTLKSQITEHKITLDQRMENLMKANDSTKAFDQQLIEVESEYKQLTAVNKSMDAMLLHIVTIVQPYSKQALAKKQQDELDKPLGMPDLMIPAQ